MSVLRLVLLPLRIGGALAPPRWRAMALPLAASCSAGTLTLLLLPRLVLGATLLLLPPLLVDALLTLLGTLTAATGTAAPSLIAAGGGAGGAEPGRWGCGSGGRPPSPGVGLGGLLPLSICALASALAR